MKACRLASSDLRNYQINELFHICQADPPDAHYMTNLLGIGAAVSKNDDFLKLKTRNSVSKTRNSVFKMMNFAGDHPCEKSEKQMMIFVLKTRNCALKMTNCALN